MKTMKCGSEIKRVKENQVNEFKKKGFDFCKKSVWKENVRDKGKNESK